MKTYTAWGYRDAARPNTLVEGERPLRFANGQSDPGCERMFWKFTANSFDEAVEIYRRKQGWIK